VQKYGSGVEENVDRAESFLERLKDPTGFAMTKIEEGRRAQDRARERQVQIPAGHTVLGGDLVVPDTAGGVVLSAHGSGSSRHSLRNRYVAKVLQQAGLATLLMDLLTPDEEALDA
jgi:hypothetical protein